jgi:hypothetical protein
MKRSNSLRIIGIIVSLLIILTGQTALTDDSCVFMVTADDVPPNIVILLDNGTAMEEIVWPAAYNNNIDYTPNVVSQSDIVKNGTATGNGFFNDNGYSVFREGNQYYLIDIPTNLPSMRL